MPSVGTDPITSESLVRRALQIGISDIGIAAASAYDSTEHAILERREAGLFADLKFTMARPETSCHPELLVDDARSVISCALCYWRPEPDEAPNGHAGTMARYTRFDAYDALVERLRQLCSQIEAQGHNARIFVDSNNHVDREAAVRSGVGFYGKHTNVITRRHGSWVVLGTIVTDLALQPSQPMRPGCGSCTMCIDACPTDAIVQPGVLDTNRCITYWTQSRHSIPHDIREQMSDMVYGCDICQNVCPWNRGVESRSASEDAVSGSVDLVAWLESPDDELDRMYERFFIPRRDVMYLRRNALVALGNSGRADAGALVRPWLQHSNPMIREHASWALQRLEHEQDEGQPSMT